MLPRELLLSDAWRSLGINGRRFIDFLFIEHMGHGGRENGRLKAPYRQLEDRGVGARHLADTIRDVEVRGLVDCHRGGRRVATTYALTWFRLHDGTPPSNRWRDFRDPTLAPLPTPKSRNLPVEGKVDLPAKARADGPNQPAKVRADGPQKLPAKGKALSRKASYQGGGHSLDGEESADAAHTLADDLCPAADDRGVKPGERLRWMGP